MQLQKVKLSEGTDLKQRSSVETKLHLINATPYYFHSQLYCDCFASSSYCSPSRCNCTACFNNLESENSRRIAVISTIERNPNAFRSKILSSNSSKSASQNQSAAEVALHHKGCHCKKSNCLKKYCECFQLGIVCSDRCRCNNCKNFPGSVERNKCLTVGIKEISQIIRKSESSLNTLESESAPPSAASSSSLSTSSAGPPDVALVRRLDDLGAILTHDVISKVGMNHLFKHFNGHHTISLNPHFMNPIRSANPCFKPSLRSPREVNLKRKGKEI